MSYLEQGKKIKAYNNIIQTLMKNNKHVSHKKMMFLITHVEYKKAINTPAFHLIFNRNPSNCKHLINKLLIED
jgi:hypothetical protein